MKSQETIKIENVCPICMSMVDKPDRYGWEKCTKCSYQVRKPS